MYGMTLQEMALQGVLQPQGVQMAPLPQTQSYSPPPLSLPQMPSGGAAPQEEASTLDSILGAVGPILGGLTGGAGAQSAAVGGGGAGLGAALGGGGAAGGGGGVLAALAAAASEPVGTGQTPLPQAHNPAGSSSPYSAHPTMQTVQVPGTIPGPGGPNAAGFDDWMFQGYGSNPPARY